jgi:hypothetical protein
VIGRYTFAEKKELFSRTCIANTEKHLKYSFLNCFNKTTLNGVKAPFDD